MIPWSADVRAAFASLIALAGAVSMQAQAAERNAGETELTEKAKQELQQLPATQSPVEAAPGSSLFRGSSAVPRLSLETPAAPAKSSDRNNEKAAAPSGGWLLDGMDELEAEENSRQRSADREERRGGKGVTEDQPRIGGAGNPLSEYLDAWLSPGNRALLDGQRVKAGSSTGSWESPRGDLNSETRTPTESGSLGRPVSDALNSFSAGETTANPYLEDSFRNDFSSARAASVSPGGSESTTTLPSILTPSQTVLPAAAPAPIEQARPVPVPPPTERLIDDRKYFPQLRRF